MNREGIRSTIPSSAASSRLSCGLRRPHWKTICLLRRAGGTPARQPARCRRYCEIVLILTTPYVHNPIRGNGNHGYRYFCPPAQARSHSLGPHLLWHRPDSAHRAGAALWSGSETFRWALCRHHSDRHVRHADYRCQLRRSEEHTSELQSHHDLVCRLLLEKKNTKK